MTYRNIMQIPARPKLSLAEIVAEHKAMAEAAANAREALAARGGPLSGLYRARAEKMRRCGKRLTIREFEAEDGTIRQVPSLVYNCRQRECPLSQFTIRGKNRRKATTLFNATFERHPDKRIIFATFTMPNVDGVDLGDAINVLNRGWTRMTRTAAWRRSIEGYLQCIEVTYSPERNDYHAHRHAVLVVDHSYFTRGDSKYIPQAKLAAMWTSAMQSPVPLIVDVRVPKARPGETMLDAAIRQVVKYVFKSGEFYERTATGYRADPDVLEAMYVGLAGPRMVGSGGIVRQSAQALKLELAFDEAEDVAADGTPDWLIDADVDLDGPGDILCPEPRSAYALCFEPGSLFSRPAYVYAGEGA